MEHKQLGVGIYQYDLPETLAKNIVDMCNQSSSIPWKKSDVGHGENPDQQVRTSENIRFPEVFPFWDEELRKYTTPAINHYAKEHEANITQDEGFNLLRYGVTQKYDFHADSNWDVYRTASILVYLNPSEYEGGATHFKYFDVKVKPEKPAIVLFPANYAYLHAAMPVTSGEKYVLVSWMNDLPRGMGPGVLHLITKAVGMC
jgi:hypothetical protein